MPLDDREQRILAEIERQFYEEDPALAHAVRTGGRSGRFGIRLPLLGVLMGVALILATFTSVTWLALVGFVVLVVSATALVQGIRVRGGFHWVTRRGEGGRGSGFGPFRRP